MYKAILFDFDGTLANDLSLFVKAYDFALKKFGIHIPEKDIPALCFHKEEAEVAANLNIPSAEEFRKYYFQGVDEIINNVPLFEDVISLLMNLQDRHIKLGIISLAKGWYIKKMVEQTGLNKYIQSVLSFDDVKSPKPDPESIFLACKNLAVKPNEILFVGDARGDIIMGKAAGCKTALFLPEDNRAYCDFESLRALNPDYIFTKYQELSDILI